MHSCKSKISTSDFVSKVQIFTNFTPRSNPSEDLMHSADSSGFIYIAYCMHLLSHWTKSVCDLENLKSVVYF